MSKPTESVLFKSIKDTYNYKRYAVIRNVANRIGWSRNDRYIDAVAMCCWPSRGLELTAFEIKTSRADYNREIRDPLKAESFSRYVDQFYLVIPFGIVSPNEIPADWGLYEWSSECLSLTCTKGAPKLSPEPLDRLFLASLLRGIS